MASTTIDEVDIALKANADSASKAVDKLSQNAQKLSSALGKVKKAGSALLTGKISNYIGKAVTATSDYIETLNLFRISMGKATDAATEFRNRAESELGLDPDSIMNAVSSIQNMAEGFGIGAEKANIMSKNVAQLAGDMSSFANMPYDDALKAIQMGIAGTGAQSRTLRQLGISLSQASLQESALALGIRTRVQDMSQAQKAELAYITIMNKTQIMQGDLARSLDSPANAMRVFQTEVKALKRAIGSMFIPILAALIPVLRAITQLATSAAKALAAMFRIQMGKF